MRMSGRILISADKIEKEKARRADRGTSISAKERGAPGKPRRIVKSAAPELFPLPRPVAGGGSSDYLSPKAAAYNAVIARLFLPFSPLWEKVAWTKVRAGMRGFRSIDNP